MPQLYFSAFIEKLSSQYRRIDLERNKIQNDILDFGYIRRHVEHYKTTVEKTPSCRTKTAHTSSVIKATTIYALYAWTPQDFFQGWAMRGYDGRKSPSRVQGQLLGGSLGAKLPEADDILSK